MLVSVNCGKLHLIKWVDRDNRAKGLRCVVIISIIVNPQRRAAEDGTEAPAFPPLPESRDPRPKSYSHTLCHTLCATHPVPLTLCHSPCATHPVPLTLCHSPHINQHTSQPLFSSHTSIPAAQRLLQSPVLPRKLKEVPEPSATCRDHRYPKKRPLRPT
jgi:hypothetical protein